MSSGAAAITRGPPTCGKTARSTPSRSCGVAPAASALATCHIYEAGGGVEGDERSDLDEREGAAVQAGAGPLGLPERQNFLQDGLVADGQARPAAPRSPHRPRP